MLRLLSLALLPSLLVALGCKASPDSAPEPVASSAATSSEATSEPVLHGRAPRREKLRLVLAASGAVDVVVRAAASRAQQDHRRVVVYVGASWCEPCTRFHHAVERGELDGSFPDVDLLTFDDTDDHDRLRAAGYMYKLIPLFALPRPDGRSSGMQVEGGIKGEGAVAEIVPRLEELLAR